MAPELVLKNSCARCHSTTELYGTLCRHMTVCKSCAKSMAEAKIPCSDCNATVTRFIREYNVRAQAPSKQYCVARFQQGVPAFSNGDTKWNMHREALQVRQVSDGRDRHKSVEKLKSKPWLLEDETGQHQFQGQLEGGQQALYYSLMMQDKDFIAMPLGPWYSFHKFVQYKQLTLEEAEEQMKNRRKTADGFHRWMMKPANAGASDAEKSGNGGRRRNDENDAGSDRGEDEGDEEGRKKRLASKKGAKGRDEDGEDLARDEGDFEDEEIERGDDWEHEETFTDDDEAVGNDPEEREENQPEVPAPPEIKQGEEDEEEGERGQEEESGGLSKSGKELKKLLGKVGGLDESDNEDEEEEDEDVDLDNEEIGLSPVLAPTKQKDGVKEEPVDATTLKTPGSSGNGRNPAAAPPASKGKRKATEETKGNGTTSAKKAKGETQGGKGAIVKKEPVSAKKDAGAAVKKEVKKEGGKKEAGATVKKEPKESGSKASPTGSVVIEQNAAITENEVKVLMKELGPVTSQQLVKHFKHRLKSDEEKKNFADIIKRISCIQKKAAGVSYIVLK